MVANRQIQIMRTRYKETATKWIKIVTMNEKKMMSFNPRRKRNLITCTCMYWYIHVHSSGLIYPVQKPTCVHVIVFSLLRCKHLDTNSTHFNPFGSNEGVSPLYTCTCTMLKISCLFTSSHVYNITCTC